MVPFSLRLCTELSCKVRRSDIAVSTDSERDSLQILGIRNQATLAHDLIRHISREARFISRSLFSHILFVLVPLPFSYGVPFPNA